MDGKGFDRITKTLAASSARRQALRASVAGIVAGALGQVSQGVEAKKKKKKKKKNNGNNNQRCAEFTEQCQVNNDCCGVEFGVVACRQTLVKDDCATQFPGLRCCGLENATCDPNLGNCACCDDLVCTIAADVKFRCQPAEP
jgi:hypothetical protein